MSPAPYTNAVGWVVSGAAAVLLLAHTAHFDHFADDAYISLRYADNWLRGEGLVFNVGERVMGYSNFLWVVLLATFGALGGPLVDAAQTLGLVFSLACVAVVSRHVAARTQGWLPAACAGLWLAASGPFALWAGAGLEGPLFAFALLIATLGAQRVAELEEGEEIRTPLGVTCAALAIATLTRPEGVGYAIALAIWLGLHSRAGVRPLGGPALACATTGLAAWLGLAAFATGYYGDALPNTYYAKTHPFSIALLERASLYSLAYLKAHGFAPALLLLGFAATHARKPQAAGWAAALMLGAFVVYYIRIGGDALVYYRMWAFTQPLMALLLAAAVAELQRAPRTRPLALAGLALPLFCLPNSLSGFELDYLRADDTRIRSLAALGAELKDLPPDTRLATNVIGALGFESRLYIVDMLGLTNAHIARAPDKPIGTPGHESHDGAYVLDQHPDLIFVGIPRATTEPLSVQLAFQPSFPSDRDLASDPRLQSDYVFQHLQLPEPDGRLVATFVRRGYSGLAAGGDNGASLPTR